MRPLAGIELDDASHARADRQERDAFVARVFAAASLPLLRIPVQRAYDLQELSARLSAILEGQQNTAPPAAAASLPERNPGATPVCPKCAVPMILRTVTKGARQGETFFGCTNYPRCRQTAV
jgi:hypothetical protein